ncbi:MAG: hypothetical protein GYA17_12805 [Chloroflexi bacterium]|nr:hypothetical protein [Chloroflexota bacterium]
MKRKRRSQAPSGTAPQDPIQVALERFRPLLSAAEFASLLEELERPLYPALRANPLKVEPAAAVESWAQRYGWETRRVPYCDTGWWVLSHQASLGQTIEHRLGEYYLQDAASMLPVELFTWDGLDRPLVLDMAASPGGKTTHLIAKTGDHGLVLANDSSQDRLMALRLVLQTWGGVNSAATRFPGESFGLWFPDTFDRILLDAPCSMQNLRSTESHPMRSITDKERGSLAQRQARLLESALQAVRVGGQVVYSTCTLAPEEDEGVLDAVLRRFGGAIQVDPVEARLPAPAPGLESTGEQVYHPGVAHAARFWPHRFGTSGFFAARLTKLDQIPSPQGDYPRRPLENAGLARLAPRDRQALLDLFRQMYAFELEAVLDGQGLDLWQRGESVMAVPELYLQRFPGLPVQALGLPLGDWTPNGFAPSHEWVMRFGRSFRAGRWTIEPEQVIPWLRGEDLPGQDVHDYARGTLLAIFDPDGRLLGRGRVTTERLKNLLPRRLAG